MLLVLVAATLPFVNTLPNAFVYDDVAVVRDNPLLRDLRGLPRLFRENYWAPLDRSNLYRPITVASYALNRALTGPGPLGFHAVNILLHALASLLLLKVARTLDVGWPGAVAAALLFAVHPLHSEAVAGIVGRAEILAACGALAALAIHARSPSGGVRGALLAALTAVSAGVGFLAKEIALGVAVALGSVDLAGRREHPRPRVLCWFLLGITAGSYFLVRWHVLGDRAFSTPTLSRLDNPLVAQPFSARMLTSAAVLGRFVGLVLWPARLSADYSYAEIPVVHWPGSLLSLLGVLTVLASVAGLCWATARGRRAIAAGLGLFLGSYFIVSNLLVLIGTIMGERLFYLPSAGLALALAPAADLLIRRHLSRPLIMIGALLLIALGGRSALRNRDWRDQETLFQRTVETAPRSIRARVFFAEALKASGNLEGAHAQFRQALQIDPQEAWTWNAMSRLYGQSDVQRAREALETALRINPRFAEAAYNLGAIDVYTGRFEEAIPMLREALEIRNYYPEASLALGEAWLGLGNWSQARPPLEAVLRARPDWGAVHFDFARLHEGEGDFRAALAAQLRAMDCVETPLESYLSAARILAREGRFVEADAALVRGRGKLGANAAIEIAAGMVRQMANDLPGARAAFLRALQVEPENQIARAHLSRLNLNPVQQ